MIGVAIVVGPDAWAGATSSFVAKLALVGASLLYAIGSIYAKRWQGMPPLVIAATLMTSGALMSLPLSLVFDRPWALPSPSLEVWLAVAFTGVFGSALAAITYFRVFAVSGATNAMLVTLLLPITPIIGGALYLGEKLAVREFAGTAVVMLALVIIDGRAIRWLSSRRT
jgi:drug/metabolite transporter (DMT)-like permease